MTNLTMSIMNAGLFSLNLAVLVSCQFFNPFAIIGLIFSSCVFVWCFGDYIKDQCNG